jgi:hypothetical protein
MKPDVGIVLTAAIIVSQGTTATHDITLRRQQYLDAARFYAKQGTVYFIEHTGYDLANDADFNSIPGIRLRAIGALEGESLGKGYREFQAMDIWYDTEKDPPARLLKITGRYIYSNIEDILAECRAAQPDIALYDVLIQDRIALTGIFSVSWADYRKYMHGIYRECNDAAGDWGERVTFRSLIRNNGNYRAFRHEPDVAGISGSSNKEMKTSRFKFAIKQAVRSVNRLFDPRHLYLRGTPLQALKKMIP